MKMIYADEIRWADHYDSDGNLSKYKVAYSDEMPPTIDAVPVEFIKGRLKDLRKILMDIDSDDVDEIWDLRTKIETLTELLDMWVERKDDGKERTV